MDRNHISPDFSSSSASSQNGHHVSRQPLYEDSTLSALMKQANQLSEIESSIQELASACRNIRRALSTLVPALEVHMHGLQSEATRWKRATKAAEEKYAQAFSALETKFEDLNEHLDTTEARLQQQHQQELSKLREEADTLRQALTEVRKFSRNNIPPAFGEGSQSDQNGGEIFDL